MIVQDFEWDHGNRGKIAGHGLSVELVEATLRGPLHVAPDPAHSAAEERFRAVGRAPDGRAVFIVFTLRDRDGKALVRPISARFMHAKEVRRYEETHS